MSENPDNLRSLQTGKFRRVVAAGLVDKLSGVERIDLSIDEPEATSHFKLAQPGGARFVKKTREFPNGNAWQLGKKAMQFELRLPEKHGVVLILDICRTDHNEVEQPVLLRINEEEWPLGIDPQNLRFNKLSWYLPHMIMKEGENTISLELVKDAATDCLIRSAAIMRFDLEKQARGNWCWAAVTTSVLKYFQPGGELTQCDVVKHCFQQTTGFQTEVDCCQHSRRKECNRTFKLGDALDLVDLHCSRCNYPLTLDELREQISHGVPVGVRIGWRGGGGHFVVVTAVGPPDPKGDNHTWVRVNDPKDPAASYIPYQSLKNRYKGEGTWTHSYLFEREAKRRK